MRNVLSSLLILSIVAAAGCHKAAEKAGQAAVEQAVKAAAKKDGQDVNLDMSQGKMTVKDSKTGETTTVQYSNDGSNVTVSGKNGESRIMSGKNAKIPEDFPKDIPVYPGIEIQSVMTDAGEGSHTYMGKSKDDLQKVGEWFKQELSKGQWTEEMDNQMTGDASGGSMRMLQFSKSERQVMIMAHGEKDGTVVSCTEGKK